MTYVHAIAIRKADGSGRTAGGDLRARAWIVAVGGLMVGPVALGTGRHASWRDEGELERWNRVEVHHIGDQGPASSAQPSRLALRFD